MKEKIKLWYAEEFSSAPIEISDEEIEFVIKKDCECDNCGESIFEIDDFPEINIENDELLCEECYDQKYRDICVICEKAYYLSDLPADFPKSPFYYIGTQNKSGIYHALQHPIFSAACGGLGDTYIWWNHLEFVCSMEDFLKSHDPELKYDFSEKWKEFGENNNIEYADFICPCCYEEALKIKLNQPDAIRFNISVNGKTNNNH